MNKQRLMELAGLNEYEEKKEIQVDYLKDNIRSLRLKLKQAGVNTSGLSDELVFKFANAMKEITIESSSPNKKNARLLEFAGMKALNLNENIESLKSKLKKSNIDVNGFSDNFMIEFANAMKNIISESTLTEMDQDIHKAVNWLSRSEIQDILERNGFGVYDSESTDDLRDALRDNVMDGTIDKSELDV